jgi:GNAT superfamily N-acetyltransferase
MKSREENNIRSRLAIRRLWAADMNLFRDHLLRLDRGSRAMRFGGMVSDAFLKDYAGTAARLDGLVFGAFLDRRLIGAAELRLILEAPAAAEAALSVEAEFQDMGVGDALLSRLIVAAQNRGVRSLYMICLAANARMRHLALKHEAEIEFADSEVRGTVRNAWPTPVSLTEEMWGEAVGFARALLRL